MREKAAGDGSSLLPWSLQPCPRLRVVPSVADHAVASELLEPAVLVYEPDVVSVTDSPTVSVSWDSTKRCSEPSCSLAALASSAFAS